MKSDLMQKKVRVLKVKKTEKQMRLSLSKNEIKKLWQNIKHLIQINK